MGCEKLSSEEKQEIERFKNSPRDSRIIGQWKFKDDVIGIYTLDGFSGQAFPICNNIGEVIKYKQDKREVYFYTENDEIIHNYFNNHTSENNSSKKDVLCDE